VSDTTPRSAALAEKERRLTGERTRVALAERRKAGVGLAT
jgi:DNA invertase Pin-like site-specific DNA recombinase